MVVVLLQLDQKDVVIQRFIASWIYSLAVVFFPSMLLCEVGVISTRSFPGWTTW